jgi:uncharacterized RDD family membrane protein YckC
MNEDEFILADKSQRIINLIFDLGAVLIIWIIFVMITVILGVYPTSPEDGGKPASQQYFVLLCIPIYWGYYFFTEYKFQKTLGKLLTKTIVVNLDGDKPTAKEILIRTLSRNIPFEYLSYLLDVVGIHDHLSKTRVVKL